MPRTSSGSSRSDRAVKPTRSTNRTLTILRSSRAAGRASASGAAQALQKRAPAGFSWPHAGQVATDRAYGARLTAGRRPALSPGAVPLPEGARFRQLCVSWTEDFLDMDLDIYEHRSREEGVVRSRSLFERGRAPSTRGDA